jgi:hypothetical protein
MGIIGFNKQGFPDVLIAGEGNDTGMTIWYHDPGFPAGSRRLTCYGIQGLLSGYHFSSKK